MLSKLEKDNYRELLFRHLDGIAIAPIAYSLHEKGVLDYIIKNSPCDISSITSKFNANEGYLNVGLRLLASQGWLTHEVDNKVDKVTITTNDKSSFAFSQIELYKDVVYFLKTSEEFHPRTLEIELFNIINKIFNLYIKGSYDSSSTNELEQAIQLQIKSHIEGILVGPITVLLGMDGMFHQYFM